MYIALVLVLLAANTIEGFGRLNCHLDQRRLHQLKPLESNIAFQKCERIIYHDGFIDNTGTYKSVRPLDGDLKSISSSAGIKLFLLVDILQEDLNNIRERSFKSNLIGSLRKTLETLELTGVVLNMNYNFQSERIFEPGHAGNILELLRSLSVNFGSQWDIGVILGSRSPLLHLYDELCEILKSTKLRFVELSAERSSSLPSFTPSPLKLSLAPSDNWDKASLVELKTLTNLWVDSCEDMKKKTYLTINPYGFTKEVDVANATIEAAMFYDFCHENISHYQGDESKTLAMITMGGQQVKYWLSHDNERTLKEKVQYGERTGLAGMSFNSLSQDDTQDECRLGKLPVFNRLVKQMAEPTEADKKAEICQLVAKYCEAP
ncbi:hypothetical protein HDE_03956 [Halotydeus destructor]|nr:hypothetical protein HDE_03956 [Halotydeus destructor]